MTKRELKKEQKQEELIAKISKMPEEDYRKLQNKLIKTYYVLNGLSLVFFATIISSIIAFGIGLVVLPVSASVLIASMVGMGAMEVSKHMVDKTRRTNNFIKSNLISMEEVEEKQKQQTQEIINRIKMERQANCSHKTERVEPARTQDDLSI